MEAIEYIIDTIGRLVNIPSPSGYTKDIMKFITTEIESYGYRFEYNQKGGLIISVNGKSNETLGLSAHVDTLGAMVRSIDEDGNLRLTLVGGYTLHSIEGSYCKIHTRDDRIYTGTILVSSSSIHCYDDAKTLERKDRNMIIRIDEVVKSKKDVLELGINSGDYVSFDAQFQYTEKGFVKSRHLDDKASVAILLGLLKDMSKNNYIPEKNLKFIISNYEEVGQGASWIPADINELLAVDMGVIGDDLNGNECSVSICAKDSNGPYDYDMTNRLISLARDRGIDYVVDIFPHYGSDVTSAISGGNNICGALIGPGVHASHGMERTHKDGLIHTLNLIKAFVGM